MRNNLEKEIDCLKREYSAERCEKEEAEERIKELRDEMAHYKADLYDIYAREGKIPNYG